MCVASKAKNSIKINFAFCSVFDVRVEMVRYSCVFVTQQFLLFLSIRLRSFVEIAFDCFVFYDFSIVFGATNDPWRKYSTQLTYHWASERPSEVKIANQVKTETKNRWRNSNLDHLNWAESVLLDWAKRQSFFSIYLWWIAVAIFSGTWADWCD